MACATFSLDTIEELDKIVRATVERRRCRERPQPARPHPRQLGACQAQPRGQVRRRPARRESAADGRAPGRRCARHLLPRRQPGDDARRLMPKRWREVRDGDRRSCGHGRHRRCRRRLPVLLSGNGAAAARNLFRGHPRRHSKSLPISYSAELWCEPGRALCAEYASVLVRVEKRRGDELYINDGAYGALFDAAHIGWRYPVRLVREQASHVRPMQFSFYGPTCDDLDRMAGPFELPARRRGRRLYRDRHARRLWLRDADPVQRFRRRSKPRSSTTNRWRASMAQSARRAFEKLVGRTLPADRHPRGSGGPLSFS